MGKPQIAAEVQGRAALPGRNDATVLAGAGAPVLLAGEAIAAPHSLSAVVPYVRALLEAGQTVEAVAHAQTLQQANMAVPDAHVLYGDALSAAGRYADAAEAYKKDRKSTRLNSSH